jgi:hypothetical protein
MLTHGCCRSCADHGLTSYSSARSCTPKHGQYQQSDSQCVSQTRQLPSQVIHVETTDPIGHSHHTRLSTAYTKPLALSHVTCHARVLCTPLLIPRQTHPLPNLFPLWSNRETDCLSDATMIPTPRWDSLGWGLPCLKTSHSVTTWASKRGGSTCPDFVQWQPQSSGSNKDMSSFTCTGSHVFSKGDSTDLVVSRFQSVGYSKGGFSFDIIESRQLGT